MRRTLIIIGIIGLLFGCEKTASEKHYVNLLEGVAKQVSTLAGGQLSEVLVSEGEIIEKGQLLAVVDTAYLHLEKQALLAAMEEIDKSLALLEIQASQAVSDRDYWQAKSGRIEQLYQSGGTPLQSYEDAQNTLAKAKTALKSVKMQMQQMQAAQEKARVQLQTVRQKIEDAHIIAPFSGQITECFYQTGEVIAAFRPLLEVIDAEVFEIRLYLSAAKLAEVQVNQQVEVQVQGVSQPISGTISWISNKAEFTPKEILTPETQSDLTYAVIVKVVDKSGALKDGLPAEVRL